MQAKAMIRIPLVYSCYDEADIEVEDIKNILSIREKKSEQASSVVRTNHGNFDTTITKKDVIIAMNTALNIVHDGEKGIIIVDANTNKKIIL